MRKKCCKKNEEECCQKENCCKNKQKVRFKMNQVGFAPILTLVFIVLKLFGAINWSWLWVLSPLWIGYGLIFLMIVLYVFLSYVAIVTGNLRTKLSKKQETLED